MLVGLLFSCHNAGAAPHHLHRSSNQLKLGTVASITLAGKDLCMTNMTTAHFWVVVDNHLTFYEYLNPVRSKPDFFEVPLTMVQNWLRAPKCLPEGPRVSCELFRV